MLVMAGKETLKKHLLITGSTIGIALAKAFAIDDQVASVTLTWRSRCPDITSDKITTKQLDLTDEEAVSSTFTHIERLDGVINAVGFLHGDGLQPEKSINRASSAAFFKNMETNTLPTMLLAKHSRRLLKDSPTGFFTSISAKVGSIEDNRLGGWYSYRASKAALNMVLKTLSIEWGFALPKCTVAALHPGTVISQLSEPFTRQGNGTLFTPEESASHLKKVLDNLTPQQSGRFWSWDGTEIPW
jgi:NAD(P)-dependent dehydrogenase (short-subunit alcohol dehydrogenase family)